MYNIDESDLRHFERVLSLTNDSWSNEMNVLLSLYNRSAHLSRDFRDMVQKELWENVRDTVARTKFVESKVTVTHDVTEVIWDDEGEEIMTVFDGNWGSIEDMANDYDVSIDEINQYEIIYAAYETPPYEGYSSVLMRKDGKLYETFGSHCSCYGLEGQWEPEETTKEALLLRSGYHSFPSYIVENL